MTKKNLKSPAIIINSIISLLACIVLLTSAAGAANTGWQQVPKILIKIKAPSFPDKSFNITDYGAVGDGNTNCTEAFKKAISAACQAGGGRVVVPAGVFLTGPIHLKSNINLYVSEGAVIKFLTDPNAYLPAVYTRWEGIECMNYSPCVYAYKQKNVAITGKGTLDGQGTNWWGWKKISDDVRQLNKDGQAGVPVNQRQYGGKTLRPNMIEPYLCKNVLIEGVTIRNGPFWHIHPVLSQNITVKNVKVDGMGPNNDGCDPESCEDVLIEGCDFNTGDDCIAIKSGRNNDGRRVNVPSENIVIRNCRMTAGHGGVTIGSEMTGGVRNVFVENCKMDSPDLRRAIRIKTNSIRGGFVENIYVRNISIGQVNEAVLKINFYYGEGDSGKFTPQVRNINMENVTSSKSEYALLLKGYQRSPVTDIYLKNCLFDNVENPDIIDNVKNLVMENVKINGKAGSRAAADND